MEKNRFSRWLMMGLILLFALGAAACSTGSSGTGGQDASATTTESQGGDNQKNETGSINKDDKSPLRVTLAGGSSGGFWTALGQAVGQTFTTEYPGTSFSYEPGSGAGNVKLVAEGQVELGIVEIEDVIAATKGMQPFTQKYEGLTALAKLYDNAVLQVAARKEFLDKYGVRSLEDIAAKKVPVNIAINQKGNLNSLLSLSILEAYGITEETVKSWGGSLIWQGSKARFEAMQNGKVDLNLGFTFAPEAKILETSVHTPLVVLPINDQAAEKVGKEWGLEKAVIPKGTYEWQTEDIQTVSLSALILASEKVSDQDLYKMAKAIVENIELLRVVHPSMKDISPEKLADTGMIPLASGAKQYYQEIGVLK
ncbi:TAXI family TRAP transporter solute-binding subunit [Bacillaceae bacterium]